MMLPVSQIYGTAVLALAIAVGGQRTTASPSALPTPTLQTAGSTAGATSEPVSADCQQAVLDDKWVHKSFAPRSGIFTAEFDATPSPTGIRSAVILSDGPSGGKTNTAVMILFEDKANRIQLRNGDRYAADQEIKYTPNAKHHFRVVVDVPKKAFSVYVTAPGAAEQALGVDYAFSKNYAFGKEQSAPAKLNNIGVSVKGDQVQPEGAINTICNLVVREGAPAAK